jgi:hypothetical protein
MDQVIGYLEPDEPELVENPGGAHQSGGAMSRRWAVCRFCGEGFTPRTLKQDVRGVRWFYRDPRRHTGYSMKMLQAERKREQTRRAV